MFDSWEGVLALVGAVLGAYGVVLWLGIVVWAYRDIRERTDDASSQTVAVLLVALFNIPGLILYLLLRPHETLAEKAERELETEAIQQELAEQQRSCPSCHRPVRDEFVFCPHCRAGLREPCKRCSRALDLGWAACPYCGAQGPGPAAIGVGAPPPLPERGRLDAAPAPQQASSRAKPGRRPRTSSPQ